MITIDIRTSQTTVLAGTGIVFDASGTTSSEVSRPFHDMLFLWNFGDVGAGSFDTGAFKQPKNLGIGPVVAHLFETPGTYVVQLVASDGVTSAADAVTITVTNPNTVFAGTETIAISQTGDFAGAPSGSTHITSADFDEVLDTYVDTGKRLLFQRGGTYGSSATLLTTVAGPVVIGAYGSGALPKVLMSGSGASDQYALTVNAEGWQLNSLDFDGNGLAKSYGFSAGVNAGRITIANCTYQDLAAWLLMSESAGIFDQIFIMGNTFETAAGGNGYNGLSLSLSDFGFVGNYVNDSTQAETLARFQVGIVGAISCNDFKNSANDKATLSLRGPDFGGTVNYDPGLYTEKVLIQNNYILPTAAQTGSVGIAPGGAAFDYRIRNVLYEKNFNDVPANAVLQNAVLTTASDVTYRNNIIKMDGAPSSSVAFSVDMRQTVIGYPVPNANHFYNNTAYSVDTGTDVTFLYTYTDDGVPTNTVARNNLFYAPNTTSPYFVNGGAGYSVTQSNNTTNAVTQDPEFASATPSVPADFRISTASYAADGGTAQFPAQNSDFFGGLDKTGDNRIGALVPRATMQVSGVPQ